MALPRSWDGATCDVLVVGAGPTGLLTALDLARHGVDVRIIDEKPGPSEHTKAIVLQARSLEVYRDVGVLEPVLNEGRRLGGFQLLVDGKRKAQVDLSGIDSPYPFPLILGQERNEAILARNLVHHGIHVAWETRLTGLENGIEGVRARVEHKGRTCTELEASYLVGADGAHSTVRGELGLAFEGFGYPETFVVADAQLDGERTHDRVTAQLRDDRFLLTFPMPDGRHRIFSLDPEPGREDAPGMDQVDELVRAVAPGVQVLDTAWTSRYHVHCRGVSRFRVGRTLLAGDAAHIHSPVGAQGMNTGIQDGYNLAWKLAAVLDGRGGEALLESYHAERYPVSQALLKSTDRAFQIVLGRNPLTRLARDHLLPRLLGLEAAQRQLRAFVSQVRIHYKGSPVVQESKGSHGPVHAGERAPDAPTQLETGAPGTIHHVLTGPRHTLLLFPGSNPEAETVQALKELSAEALDRLGHETHVHVVDATDEAACERYGATRMPTAVLVRPDGHIGYLTHAPSPGELAAYIEEAYGDLPS